MTIDQKYLEEKLNGLTGLDYEAAKRRFRITQPNFIGVEQLQSGFQIEIAALALGVNVHELQNLPLKQYSKLCNLVSNFLFSDSETEEVVAEN